MTKKAFHFMLKALFILKISKFLSRLFRYVKTRFDKKTKVADWTTRNYNTYVAQYFNK